MPPGGSQPPGGFYLRLGFNPQRAQLCGQPLGPLTLLVSPLAFLLGSLAFLGRPFRLLLGALGFQSGLLRAG